MLREREGGREGGEGGEGGEREGGGREGGGRGEEGGREGGRESGGRAREGGRESERERRENVISTRSGVATERSAAKLQNGHFQSKTAAKNIQSPNRQKFTSVNKVVLISLTFSVRKIRANGTRKCQILL